MKLELWSLIFIEEIFHSCKSLRVKTRHNLLTDTSSWTSTRVLQLSSSEWGINGINNRMEVNSRLQPSFINCNLNVCLLTEGKDNLSLDNQSYFNDLI